MIQQPRVTGIIFILFSNGYLVCSRNERSKYRNKELGRSHFFRVTWRNLGIEEDTSQYTVYFTRNPFRIEFPFLSVFSHNICKDRNLTKTVLNIQAILSATMSDNLTAEETRELLDSAVMMYEYAEMDGIVPRSHIFFGKGIFKLANKHILAVMADSRSLFPLDVGKIYPLLEQIHREVYPDVPLDFEIEKTLIKSYLRLFFLMLDRDAIFRIQQLSEQMLSAILLDTMYDYRHISNYYPHLIIDSMTRFVGGVYGPDLSQIVTNANMALRESLADHNSDTE